MARTISQMTTDELKKEAERLLQDYGLHWDKESVTIRVANGLRAIHDAAVEKAAMTIEGHTFVCDKVATSVNELIEKVRALKMSSAKASEGDGK